MKNLFLKHYTFLVIALSASIAFSSCSGGKSAVDETWSLVELVTVGDPIENSSSEIIEVKNCGIPVEISTDCSAGTSRDLSVTITSGDAIGVSSQFIIEGNVETSLGIGQQSGQSVTLPNPPSGNVYLYTIDKVYRIVNGEALARSSNGDEQVVNYKFHASCSINIVDRKQIGCTSEDFATATPSSIASENNKTYLSELSPRIVEAAGGNYCIGRDPVGDPPTCTGAKINVQGTPYPHSLFAHADSVLVFDLNGNYETFVTSIILQGGDCGDGASFRIELDGKEVFKSPVIQHGEVPRDLRIDVKNGYVLRLETYTGGNNDYFCDGTIWGEPYLISKP